MPDLTLRVPLGAPLSAVQGDTNLTILRDAINAMEAAINALLTASGALKADSVNTAAIQDRAVTLSKLAFLSNFYAVDTGAVNAYAIAFTPQCAAYAAGMQFWVKPITANTGAATLQVDALAPVPIQYNGAALTGGELPNGMIFGVEYDGAVFQLLTKVIPVSKILKSFTTTSGPINATCPVNTALVIPHTLGVVPTIVQISLQRNAVAGTDVGYGVGDIVPIYASSFGGVTNLVPFTVFCDAANLSINRGTQTANLTVYSKTAPTNWTAIDETKWQFLITLYA